MSVIDLALFLDREAGMINVHPRDEASQVWLFDVAYGGQFRGAFREVSQHWALRGVSRRDLPAIAAHLEVLLNRTVKEGALFRVRACEYVDVERVQSIREIVH